MTPPLSYAATKCVLEHMEALKRLHFSSRCASIASFEKSVPLRLRFLQFEQQSTKINDLEFMVIYGSEEDDYGDHVNKLEFGDIPATRKFQNPKVYIEFSLDGDRSARRLVFGITQVHVAARELNTILLGGRKQIIVENLEIGLFGNQVLRLPLRLKLKVKNFDAGVTDFMHFFLLLDSSSFPLKSLKINGATLESLHLPIIQNAENLTIGSWEGEIASDNNWITYFKSDRHKVIVIDGGWVPVETILKVMEYWLKKGKAVGSCFKVCESEANVVAMLEKVAKRFGGNVVEMEEEETDERLLPNTRYISIPMNLDSELIVYGIREDSYHDHFYNGKFIFKVMPIGSSSRELDNFHGETHEVTEQVFEKLRAENAQMEKDHRVIF